MDRLHERVTAFLIGFILILTILPLPEIESSAPVPYFEKSSRGTIVVNASGGGDYTHIQWAIDNASEGDIVFVEAGTYHENILVNKSISLVGAGRHNTTIDGDRKGSVIRVWSNWVNISGFKIMNSSINPLFWEFALTGGIMGGYSNSRFENNHITRNHVGIQFSCSDNLTISNNICDSNFGTGIWLDNSQNCLIENNTSNNTSEAWHNPPYGIYINNSFNNLISNNDCNNNSRDGILLVMGMNNIIANNTFTRNRNGIQLMSDNNCVINNTCKDNIIGILINVSWFNNVTINSIVNNSDFGLKCRDLNGYCHNNLVYHNSFISNNLGNTQASDNGPNNCWNFSRRGNYWSDQTGPDLNADGIVDNPYRINGTANARDFFPLVEPITVLSPIALAGPNITIDQHQVVNFNGSRSWGFPAIVNYSWSFNYNSTNHTLYGLTPSFTFHVSGLYNVTLTITDNNGNKDMDWLKVQVLDVELPIPDAGPDAVISQGKTYYFNGNKSMDNVGIVNYTWNFIYNNNVQLLFGIAPHYKFDIAGEYSIELNTSDVRDNWATDEMILTVRDASWPIARAGEDVTIDQQETLYFNGSSSYDNVGIINYTWTFVYDQVEITLYGSRPGFKFLTAGLYVVTLNVTDAERNWDSDVMTVTVRDITPPVAIAGDNITIGQGEMAFFNGNSSYDNVGIANYSWRFLYDNMEIEIYSMIASYKFDIAGNYSVTLLVTDFEWNNDTDDLWLIVLGKDNEIPSVDNDTPDLDSDNDGWNDTIENLTGTDPFDNTSIPADMDNDTIPDKLDPDRDGDDKLNIDDFFPDDPDKWEREDENVEDGFSVYIWIGILLVIFLIAVVAVLVREVVRKKGRKEIEQSSDGEFGRIGKDDEDMDEKIDLQEDEESEVDEAVETEEEET